MIGTTTAVQSIVRTGVASTTSNGRILINSFADIQSLPVAKLMKKSTRQTLARTWGYLLLPIIAWAWFVAQLGPSPIAIMSVLAAGFFLFQAPAPCCAETRKGEWCRNNGSGVLGGCHFRNHRWQNVKMLLDRELRQRAANGILRGISGKAATLSAVISTLALLVSVGMLLVNMSKAA